MVAKITTPHTILRVLNYNEKKVMKGCAECIHAENFLHDAGKLNFYDKLERFKGLIVLNSRAKTNMLHISLNFDPSEKFSKEKLVQIAETYMGKIGFAEQPYLVYQHFDAGHPHLHIVTTNIRENGKRIDTYNIGKNQSQKARKEIEIAYGLMRAEGGRNEKNENVEAASVQRVSYGLSETKKSISNVLNVVINQYKFTSLAELNAVLKLYNVIADRGSEESRTYKNQGLHYRLLDEKGNKVGVPIKASSIYFKPTLQSLKEIFVQNQFSRLSYKSKLKIAIDWTLSKKTESISEFVFELQKERITAMIRESEQGFIYGITFIDHRNKTVFNGSDIGKMYSAKGIKERIAKSIQERTDSAAKLLERSSMQTLLLQKPAAGLSHSKQIKQDAHQKQDPKSVKQNLWELLMNRERNDLRIPFDFMKKKKKRQKPNL